MSVPTRKSQLAWPPNKQQWADLNDELEAIYRRLRNLHETAENATGPHDILSATHEDSTAHAEVDGDMITGQGGRWSRLAKGTNGDFFQMAAGSPAWAAEPNSGVAAGVYGSGVLIPQLTINSKGRITNAVDVSAFGGLTVTASVYRATNQTLTSAVEAAISLSDEHFDVNNLWVIGSPTKFICPTALDGVYWFNGQIQLGTGFAGVAHVRLYKNGTLVAQNSAAGSDLASGDETHTVQALIDLVATDYVELKVLLTLAAGGTFDIVGGSRKTFLQAARQTPQAATVPLQGSMILLEQHTAAASAQLDFTTFASATYDEYIIELVNVLPATDNVTFSCRFSTDGGATFDSAANYKYTYHYKNSAGASGVVGNNAGTSFEVCGNLDNAAAGGGLSGSYRLFNPLSATARKAMLGQVAFLHNDTDYYRTDHGSWYISATAVNAVRFFMSSGNIASGVIRIYGVSK